MAKSVEVAASAPAPITERSTRSRARVHARADPARRRDLRRPAPGNARGSSPSMRRWPSSTPAWRPPRPSGGAATRCCSASNGCSTAEPIELWPTARADGAPGRRALRHPRRADHRDRGLVAAESWNGAGAAPAELDRRRPRRPPRRRQRRRGGERGRRGGRRGGRDPGARRGGAPGLGGAGRARSSPRRPRIRGQAAASGSSTPRARARRSPRSGSSRRRAPAAS